MSLESTKLNNTYSDTSRMKKSKVFRSEVCIVMCFLIIFITKKIKEDGKRGLLFAFGSVCVLLSKTHICHTCQINRLKIMFLAFYLLLKF